MKALPLLALATACLIIGTVAVSDPPAKIRTSHLIFNSMADAPTPCLVNTKKCTELADAPAEACLIGTNLPKSCPTEGAKVIPARLR